MHTYIYTCVYVYIKGTVALSSDCTKLSPLLFLALIFGSYMYGRIEKRSWKKFAMKCPTNKCICLNLNYL